MPHVRELCLTEMIARTAKDYINRKIANLIMQNKAQYDSLKQQSKEYEAKIEELETSANYRDPVIQQEITT